MNGNVDVCAGFRDCMPITEGLETRRRPLTPDTPRHHHKQQALNGSGGCVCFPFRRRSRRKQPSLSQPAAAAAASSSSASLPAASHFPPPSMPASLPSIGRFQTAIAAPAPAGGRGGGSSSSSLLLLGNQRYVPCWCAYRFTLTHGIRTFAIWGCVCVRMGMGRRLNPPKPQHDTTQPPLRRHPGVLRRGRSDGRGPWRVADRGRLRGDRLPLLTADAVALLLAFLSRGSSRYVCMYVCIGTYMWVRVYMCMSVSLSSLRRAQSPFSSVSTPAAAAAGE